MWPSNNSNLFHFYNKIETHFRKFTKTELSQAGYGFSTLGISKDWNVNNGINHLRKYGFFDEIITGKSWNGLGLNRYVYTEIPGEATTPQILITVREYIPIKGRRVSYRGIANEKLLVRKVGLDEIKYWAQGGFRIPKV